MPVSINKWLAALAALALVLGTVGRTRGETIIDYNTTIDSNIADDVHVVEGSNPNPPTVVDVEASVNTLSAFDSSIVNLRRGGAYYVDACDSSTLNIFDGWWGGEVLGAGGSSTVNMSGGSIEMLSTGDSSTVNMSGGYLELLLPRGSSTVNISAGATAGLFEAGDSSTVNIFGGEIQEDLLADHSSTIHVFGYDLQLTEGLLTGTLADGSPLNNQAVALENGRFVLHVIPEPSSLAMLVSMAAAGLALCVWRRRRH